MYITSRQVPPLGIHAYNCYSTGNYRGGTPTSTEYGGNNFNGGNGEQMAVTQIRGVTKCEMTTNATDHEH